MRCASRAKKKVIPFVIVCVESPDPLVHHAFPLLRIPLGSRAGVRAPTLGCQCAPVRPQREGIQAQRSRVATRLPTPRPHAGIQLGGRPVHHQERHGGERQVGSADGSSRAVRRRRSRPYAAARRLAEARAAPGLRRPPRPPVLPAQAGTRPTSLKAVRATLASGTSGGHRSPQVPLSGDVVAAATAQVLGTRWGCDGVRIKICNFNGDRARYFAI